MTKRQQMREATQARYAELARLWRAGVAPQRIAERLGYAGESVGVIASRLGLGPHPRPWRIARARLRRALILREQGLNLATIAARLEYASARTVAVLLCRHRKKMKEKADGQ